MAEIDRILASRNREVTTLAVPAAGSAMDVVNEWFGRYRSAVQEALSISESPTSLPEVSALVRRIDEALLEYSSANRVIATKGGLDALAEMSEISLEVEREANALMSRETDVAHADIDPTLGRLGEIVYAFQNGFGEMPNPVATFGSLVLASVVDILPLLLAFALFGPGRLDAAKKLKGRVRGKGGRTVITSGSE